MIASLSTVMFSILKNNFVNYVNLFFFSNTKSSLYWGIADYQYCDSFRWTVKGLSHTYTYTYTYTYTRIHSPPSTPPIQAGTWHWTEFHVLHNRFLLVIHFKYSSVCMTFPKSVTVPSHWQPWVHFLSLWVFFCFVSKFICIISF